MERSEETNVLLLSIREGKIDKTLSQGQLKSTPRFRSRPNSDIWVRLPLDLRERWSAALSRQEEVCNPLYMTFRVARGAGRSLLNVGD